MEINRIWISNNDIGSEGAGYVAEALKNKHLLTTLGINSNNIGCIGAELITEAFKDSKSLRTVWLAIRYMLAIITSGAKGKMNWTA